MINSLILVGIITFFPIHMPANHQKFSSVPLKQIPIIPDKYTVHSLVDKEIDVKVVFARYDV